MRDHKFWQQLNESIEEYAVLFVVIAHEGSSPGKTGFKMAIVSGKQIGTIGGGIMEKSLINEYSNIDERIKIKELIHRSGDENASGLICSGSQRVFIQKIHKDTVNKIIASTGDYLCYYSNGIVINKKKDDEVYCEKIGVGNRLHIFGAGHVGMAIYRTMRNLNFKIFLYDHRNIGVDELIIGSFDKTINKSRIQEGDYCVITTYGFNTDYHVLRNLFQLDLDFKYIGLMGSKAKINKIKKLCDENSILKEFTARINAPIGLPISDGSAEEIAISVAAQIIQTKNSM